MITKQLLQVLEHCVTTGVKVEGVSSLDMLSIMRQLQPVDGDDYATLLWSTKTKMLEHAHDMMDQIDNSGSTEDYDVTVLYGNNVARLQMNADLYSSFESMMDEQLKDWD